MDKKFRLPKEGFIDGTEAEGLQPTDQDVTGHQLPPTADEPAQTTEDGEDVEGHRVPPGTDFTVLPPPPSIGLQRTPGHGGE